MEDLEIEEQQQELYDMHGRRVYTNNNFQSSIFNFQFPAGIFLLRAIAPDGTSHTEKLIIYR